MLVVKYSNGLITDPVNESVEESGYPAWWSQETDYQHGPKVYALDKLRETDGLNFTGQSVWVPKNASFEEILSII